MSDNKFEMNEYKVNWLVCIIALVFVVATVLMPLILGNRGSVEQSSPIVMSTIEPTLVIAETITEPTTEPTVVATEPQYTIVINEEDAIALAKMAWGEARGCSDMEIAATMWCVLNRVDAKGGTVVGIITAPNQFHGYSPNHPVDERIYNLAVDVLTRWQMEQQGASPEEVGRVLPPQYLYFYGDGVSNHFKDNYEYSKANIWDWSYPNPYGTEES